MAKNILAFFLCFTLILSFYVYSYTQINEKKTDVTIEKNIVYGDEAYAKGVGIEIPSSYNGLLKWNTKYTIGENSEPETTFEFNKKYQYKEIETEGYLNLYSSLGGRYITSTGIEAKKAISETDGIERAYFELVQQAQPYVEESKVIRVKDYCDYYPLSFDLSCADTSFQYYYDDFSSNYELKLKEYFESYFKIPVLENERIEIYVTVNDDGMIFQSGSSSTPSDGYYESFELYTDSAEKNGDIYFIFNNRTSENNLIDTSEIKDGFGIYRFKKPEIKNEELILSDIEMVYAIDVRDEPVTISFSADKTKLYLTKKAENGELWFSVIDAESYELIEEIQIFNRKNFTAYVMHITEDFLLLEIGADRFNYSTETFYTVISIDENGKYEQEITVPVYNEAYDTYFYIDYSDAKWDGERLYYIKPFEDSFNEEPTITDTYCGVTICIYDKDGIQFAGKYDLSLSTGKGKYEGSDYYVKPDYYEKTVFLSLP